MVTIAVMLLAFRLHNFRSFLTEQTFSYSTSADRTHESTHLMRTGMKSIPRVSKAAIVFGPNASGKSNLLIGLATFRDLILHSTGYSDAQFAERYTPFRFGPAASRATAFELDVMLDRVRYRYALSYDAQRILSERLLVYRTGKAQRWFERRFDAAGERDAWVFSHNFSGQREVWRKATRRNSLFLTTAAQLSSEQLAPLMHWVAHHLDILLPHDIGDLDQIVPRLQDPNFKERLIRLLRAVDIQIDDVRAVTSDLGTPAWGLGTENPHRLGGARPSIEFLYNREGWAPTWADSVFESAGTQRLLGLFGPLMDAIEGGKLLLIDEFDTSLHPLIARFLIQLINNPLVSHRGAQLLLTSHNTTLMDLDILRRDEIWLMQLSVERASQLAPLLRSSPRKRELVAKNYLKGRYSAVPCIHPQLPDKSDH
jgi:hypothetical protein